MNKLYLLGALLLSNVEAYVGIAPAPTQITLAASSPKYGTYTYTSTSDCYSSVTGVTLDALTKTYYQYYPFSIGKGTVTFSTSPYPLATYAYKGCTHVHLYSYMGTPTVASGAQAGLGDSVVAYGYAMTGTAVTACAAPTVVTSIFSTSPAATGIYSASRYQGVAVVIDIGGTITPVVMDATISNSGSTGTYTGPGTLAAVPGTPAGGWTITVTQNYWWDFAQTSQFSGLTAFGRGGGTAGTTPCGWWVFYAYEMPTPSQGSTDPAATPNVQLSPNDATVHMWTDNALTNTIGAFVLAGLAAILY